MPSLRGHTRFTHLRSFNLFRTHTARQAHSYAAKSTAKPKSTSNTKASTSPSKTSSTSSSHNPNRASGVSTTSPSSTNKTPPPAKPVKSSTRQPLQPTSTSSQPPAPPDAPFPNTTPSPPTDQPRSRFRPVLYTLTFAATTAVAAIYGAGLRTQHQEEQARQKLSHPYEPQQLSAEEVKNRRMKEEKARLERLEFLEMRRKRLKGQKRELEGKVGVLRERMRVRADGEGG